MAAGFGVHHEWGKLREVIIGISPAEDFVVFHEESMRWQVPAEAELIFTWYSAWSRGV